MIIIIINDFLPSYTLLHKWIPEITNRIPPYTIRIRYGLVPCLISLQFKCVSKKIRSINHETHANSTVETRF